MKRTLHWGCLALLLVITSTRLLHAQSNPTATRAIPHSGGRISSGGLTVVGAIGQPVVGQVNGGYTVRGGFFAENQLLVPPVGAFKLYLPLIQQ